VIPDEVKAAARRAGDAAHDNGDDALDEALKVVDAWLATVPLSHEFFERYAADEQRRNVRMEACLRSLINPAYHFDPDEQKRMMQRALSDVDDGGFPR